MQAARNQTLHKVGPGGQACTMAADTVSSVIEDLDAAILSVRAGTLNHIEPKSRADLGESAQNLLDNTKALLHGAATNHADLSVLVHVPNCARNILNLSDAVKNEAALLEVDKDVTVSVICEGREVAAALMEVVEAAKDVCEQNLQEPDLTKLKEAVESMENNINSLLEAIKKIVEEILTDLDALYNNLTQL